MGAGDEQNYVQVGGQVGVQQGQPQPQPDVGAQAQLGVGQPQPQVQYVVQQQPGQQQGQQVFYYAAPPQQYGAPPQQGGQPVQYMVQGQQGQPVQYVMQGGPQGQPGQYVVQGGPSQQGGQPVQYMVQGGPPQQGQPGQPIYVGQPGPVTYIGAPYAQQPTIIVQQSSYNYAAACARAALLCYFFTYWCFITQVISVAYSLHMVRRGYIVKRKNEVIAFSILELVGWCMIPGFAWYFELDCTNTYYYDGYYDCIVIWWGWIAFLIWGIFILAFGIPRIVFTWNYDNKRQTTAVTIATPAPGPMTTVVYASPPPVQQV